MAFDFDRPPRGLTYTPVELAGLPSPMWVLYEDGCVWVELRSLCELLKISWPKCRSVFRQRGSRWGLEGSMDSQGRETQVIRMEGFGRWLNEMKPILMAHSKICAERTVTLSAQWREALGAAIDEHWPELAESSAMRRNQERSHRITAEVVYILFAQLQSGASFRVAGRAAGIAATDAKRIASDRYPGLPESARRAWDETFGLP